MKIVHIIKDKAVLKTKEQYEKELKECRDEMSKILVSRYELVPAKEFTYVVEMSPKELQLVNYYLELDGRKQITNNRRNEKGRFKK